ncbi:MAG: hypothetical protein M3198_08510 [Actinomycetota bacterium]|nr:hypothetical protein [Actinomycetota bacterium]
MAVARTVVRTPLLPLVIGMLLMGAAIGFWTAQVLTNDGSTLRTELTNHSARSDRAAAPAACEPRGRYAKARPPGKEHKECEEKPPSNAQGRPDAGR